MPKLEQKDSDGDLESANSNGSSSTVTRIDLPDTGVGNRTIRYKNVNF